MNNAVIDNQLHKVYSEALRDAEFRASWTSVDIESWVALTRVQY